MNITRHANKRIQQRGFKKEYLELLLKYGDYKRKPGNVMEVRITKKEISRITQDINVLKRKLLNLKNKRILVDQSMNTIITAYNGTH